MSTVDLETTPVLSYRSPLDPQEIAAVRHSAENPLFIVCIVFGAIISLLLLFTIVYLPMIVAMIFIGLYQLHARTRASAIRVSERNFPEIYKKSVEFAEKLGMRKVPAVYIVQQNGMLNAFAAAVVGKRYASINAEIVDVAYSGDKDFEPVYYVLAHEFAHHYFKHTSIFHVFVNFFGMLVPIIGTAHSRAREYSSDRLAQLLMGKDCAREAMLLSAGRRLYSLVDLGDYLENAKTERGFFLWMTNLFSTHPIQLKRIAALADPNRENGELF